MKRLAVIILVLLILVVVGAVETVLVSWGLARWAPVRSVEWSPPQWSHDAGDGWYYQVATGATWEMRAGLPIKARARTVTTLDPTVTAPSGSVFRDRPVDRSGDLSVVEIMRGWPRPALAYDFDIDARGASRGPVRGGIELSPASPRQRRALPIRPIRGAFILNTAVAAVTTVGLVALIWISVRTARRLFRRRRGRCPKCGYIVSRTESATCPECGGPVRASRTKAH